MNPLVFLLRWFSRPLLTAHAVILLGLRARAVIEFLPLGGCDAPKEET